MSEHAITELELKCKDSSPSNMTTPTYLTVYTDILTRPDSLQWKGYRLTYANGKEDKRTEFVT